MGRVGHGLAAGISLAYPEAAVEKAGEAAIELNAKPPGDRTPEEIDTVEALSSLALMSTSNANLALVGRSRMDGPRGING